MGRSGGAGAEPAGVATPEGLTLAHHRDLKGRERRPVARWVLISVLVLFLGLGLLNLFGQVSTSSSAAGVGGQLEVSAPERLRGGLYFQARFTVSATEELENAVLVLDQGWLEGMTLNTLAPAPVGEASRDGNLVFELGRVPSGQEHVLYLQFQVNPTTVGRRSQDVQLYDGDRLVTRIDRSARVWP